MPYQDTALPLSYTTIWLRRWELNPRFLGYEPNDLTTCPLRYVDAKTMNALACALVWTTLARFGDRVRDVPHNAMGATPHAY